MVENLQKSAHKCKFKMKCIKQKSWVSKNWEISSGTIMSTNILLKFFWFFRHSEFCVQTKTKSFYIKMFVDDLMVFIYNKKIKKFLLNAGKSIFLMKLMRFIKFKSIYVLIFEHFFMGFFAQDFNKLRQIDSPFNFNAFH